MNKPKRRREHARPHLFRWAGRWELVVPLALFWPPVLGWIVLGWSSRREDPGLILYWSPDATPTGRAGGLRRYAAC